MQRATDGHQHSNEKLLKDGDNGTRVNNMKDGDNGARANVAELANQKWIWKGLKKATLAR